MLTNLSHYLFVLQRLVDKETHENKLPFMAIGPWSYLLMAGA